MQIVYLNDYYRTEEELIYKYGIPCSRINYPFQGDIDGLQEPALFRGPKMQVEAYSQFICDLERIGGTALVGVSDFKKISDAIEYSKCFEKYAPKVITFDFNQSISEIAKLLAHSNLTFPLFVRSDIESAAKYVGVEACTLRSSEPNDIELVLDPIHKFIANARTIIMKEIVSVKKTNGKTIEYRAIVFNGKIVCFDYDSSSGLPNPESLPYAWQFEDCINAAYQNGLHGAYFVDFGVDEKNENLFVVECKNIINGTVKNLNAFAEGLVKIAVD